MALRIIIDGYRDPLMNMALDEALFFYREKTSFDTLRLYMWRPSGVSIGRSQNIYDTLNIECVRKLGYIPVKRPTGGGALLHMENGEITYSVVIGRGNPLFNLDIKESSIALAKGVLYALNYLGLNPGVSGVYSSKGEPLCYFRRGTSDILVNDRKISGSAQVRKAGALLQHGTLLIKLDYDKWSCVIREVDMNTLKNKVTSLNSLGVDYSLSKIINSLIRGFTVALDKDYFYGSYLPEELELAEELYRTKYLNWLRNMIK